MLGNISRSLGMRPPYAYQADQHVFAFIVLAFYEVLPGTRFGALM